MAKRKSSNANNKTRSTSHRRMNESLVSKDFFTKDINVNTNEIFPMVVMATMSSGKSTLINALLGQQILPSRNEACTAKMYSILDDDQTGKTKIFVTYKNGVTVVKDEDVVMELEKANSDNEVTDILIRGHVKGVLNTDKALLIVDTPGPNNSRDESHKQVMLDVLKKINGGLILYVLNATQFGMFPTIYRIDRIQNVKVLDEHFKIPYKDRFEEGEYRKRIQFMYGGKLQRTMFWYKGLSVEAVLDRLPTAKILREEDGKYLVSAETFGKGIEMWLRSQGDLVEVVEK